MIVRMAKCIGRAGCDGEPASRGLCHSCYQRHRGNGTLHVYPTMGERLRALDKTTPLQLIQSTPDYSRTYRQRRHAERVQVGKNLVHPSAKHGRISTYVSFGCRGPMCRASQAWYRDTGETCVPAARQRDVPMKECVEYVNQRYE